MQTVAVSCAMQARRVFVKVTIGLSAVYGVLLNVTRDSPEGMVVSGAKDCERVCSRSLLHVLALTAKLISAVLSNVTQCAKA